MSTQFEPLPGDRPISFNRLMALKQNGDDTFESLTGAWPPGPMKRAFGGHVYAQAMYAASKTVAKGFVVHQMTGYFILPGAIDVPFEYRVRRVRDGGIYCLRAVDVFQQSHAAADGRTPCFTATMSFKRSERGNRKWQPWEYQNVPKEHIKTEYGRVLDGLNPQDHILAPASDALWWIDSDYMKRVTPIFPGVETRKVDMTKYNGQVELGRGIEGEAISKYRQLLFYRLYQDEEGDGDVDLNLHAAAHLYTSDRNSLFLIQRALGYEKVVCSLASLSHTVIFHGFAEDLCMIGENGKSKWFVQESWTSHGGENRGTHHSLLWDCEKGKVIATTIQDGMIRVPKESADKIAMGKEDSGKASKL
ncbi:acyl-CoA thioesterase [Exophiala viscosa]|uniref:Acyl-CoA thioesterase n=1 Tax=Exophiala viscosa TaxID=2486360 RepID=A0AAN6DUT1_9EURO|nr:acyl-CoA thioesterase [Exophiala viscosa]